MHVVIAPDKFKGVLDAGGAARAIAEGVRRARPAARVTLLPMADGARGNRRQVAAHGPLGEPMTVQVGLVEQASRAVVELASVSGLSLVPPDRRDVMRASTFGLGEVLRCVIEAGIEDVLLAVGGSATVDGGAGMLQALGATFHDHRGRVMDRPISGGDLLDIRRFAWDRAPEGIVDAVFTVAVDVLNPATGPDGAARVFAPQKGADAAGVKRLEAGLTHWADVLAAATGRDVRHEHGTGAAGGVALPLLALCTARIEPGIDLVIEAVGLSAALADADLLITGEGRLDRQSTMGKVVGTLARMARAAGVPVAAIVGAIGEGAEPCLAMLDRCIALDGPMERTRELLEAAGQRAAGELL
jgi:glycerate kinase